LTGNNNNTTLLSSKHSEPSKKRRKTNNDGSYKVNGTPYFSHESPPKTSRKRPRAITPNDDDEEMVKLKKPHKTRKRLKFGTENEQNEFDNSLRNNVRNDIKNDTINDNLSQDIDLILKALQDD